MHITVFVNIFNVFLAERFCHGVGPTHRPPSTDESCPRPQDATRLQDAPSGPERKQGRLAAAGKGLSCVRVQQFTIGVVTNCLYKQNYLQRERGKPISVTDNARTIKMVLESGT